jgi:hypothetical protein
MAGNALAHSMTVPAAASFLISLASASPAINVQLQNRPPSVS